MNSFAESVAPDAEAGWFGPPTRQRFGWIHQPSCPASGVGMVIVPPFGFEAVCAHRSVRQLAINAAKAGMLALRFDLDGTGDSDGDDLDSGRVEAWLASVDDACNLARHAGAKRIVLAGIRLGAALATLAAVRRDDIAGLVAINPVIRGKAFLREGRALQMALDLQAAPQPERSDVRELVGFAISAETVEALTAIDLRAMSTRPAASVLLIERDDLPTNDTWPAHLRDLGAEVEVQRLPGYAEMMLDPHNTVVPTAMLAATVTFADACAERAVPASTIPAIELASRVNLRTASGEVVEQVEALGQALFAISSGPVNAAPTRGVLLLNAGAVGHCGPNRLHVVLARQRAAAGDLVLRLDLSGLGDSAARAGAAPNVVYGEHALDEVATAVAWLRDVGVDSVVAIGLCSGGYHAFKAALAGQSIDLVGVINPLTFDYRQGMSLELSNSKVLAESKRYGASMRSGAAWKKLLRGEVSIRYVTNVVLRRIGSFGTHRVRDILRRLHVPLRDDLGTSLVALGQRGVRTNFIFSDTDPGHSLLLEQAGQLLPRLKDNGSVSVQIIAGADHTFTARWTQPLVFDAVTSTLT